MAQAALNESNVHEVTAPWNMFLEINWLPNADMWSCFLFRPKWCTGYHQASGQIIQAHRWPSQRASEVELCRPRELEMAEVEKRPGQQLLVKGRKWGNKMSQTFKFNKGKGILIAHVDRFCMPVQETSACTFYNGILRLRESATFLLDERLLELCFRPLDQRCKRHWCLLSLPCCFFACRGHWQYFNPVHRHWTTTSHNINFHILKDCHVSKCNEDCGNKASSIFVEFGSMWYIRIHRDKTPHLRVDDLRLQFLGGRKNCYCLCSS